MYTKTTLKFKQRQIDRSPRLDTILMIEAALYKYRSEKTLTEIWRLLPKKVMWTTFTTAVRYIEYSGKILIEKDRTVTWIWNPRLVERIKRQGLVVR